MAGELLRRLIDRLFMPWYDRKAAQLQLKAADDKLAAEEAKGVRTEDIRRRSIAARISAEKTRAAYEAYSRRVER